MIKSLHARALTVLTMALTGTGAATAESVVAARMLPAQTVIEADDLVVRREAHPGAIADPSSAIGMETRANIYAGRPVRPEDLAPPAIIDRNQIVTLNYFHAGIVIATEGRALDRAGPGARVRVMNMTSRSTVIGTVMIDGSVNVAPAIN